jgi:hypothetical protein
MNSPKSDLLQGTLDMLVLKVVALEPIHGYGIANASARSRGMSSKCSRGPSIPLFIAWKSVAG